MRRSPATALALALFVLGAGGCGLDTHPGAPLTVNDFTPATQPPGGPVVAGDGVVNPAAGAGPLRRPAPVISYASDQPAPPGGQTGVVADPNGVSFNFVDAEISSVAAAVLGGTLGLSYTVDSRVQGRITLQTSAPLARDTVLPTLESVLRANGVALARQTGGMIQLVPADSARFGLGGAVVGSGREAGWRTQIVPLRVADAANLQKTLEGMAGQGASVRAEPRSNALVITGGGAEIAAMLDAVAVFDAEELRGRSFGLYRLQRATPAQAIEELDLVFHINPKAAVKDVRFVPLDRLNAVLALTRSRDALRKVSEWIERIDRPSDSSDAQLYVYKVESGRATHLAEVLAKLYPEHAVDRVGRDRAQGADGTTSGGSTSGASSGGAGLSGSNGATGGALTATGRAGAMLSAVDGNGAGGNGAASPAAATAAGLADGAGAARPDALAGAAADQRLATGPAGAQRPLSGVRIVADASSNTLLIMARPAVYQQIESTLRKIDVVPAQVQIEATIAEVRLNDALSFGIQYFIKSGNNTFRFSSAKDGVVASSAPGFSYIFAGGDARVVLDALKAVTDVNILSTPTLMVLDNQTARLQVGDQVPIITSTSQSATTSDSPIISQVQLKDTGVILSVTPRITAGGAVLMDVWQEVSDVVRTTTSDIDSPSFQRRRIESSVAIANTETIALGGLIRQNRSRDRSGLPLLSDIPVMGALFGTRGSSFDRTELLVLITPRIVRSTRDARAATEELRRRLSDRVIPVTTILP